MAEEGMRLIQIGRKCIGRAMMISLGCLLSNLSGSEGQKASLSNCSLVNSLETVNIAPVKDDNGYRFQAIEPVQTEKDLNGCCVFTSLATAIELARHPGSPLITVNSQDIRKIRDSFTCELKSLLNVCRTYIKSISFDEVCRCEGRYRSLVEFSEPKTEEWSDDQKKTLCRYIRTLGKGKDVDALMQKLPKVTKTILDTIQGDLEKRNADGNKRKVDLEKRGFDVKQTEKELLNKAEKTSDGEDVKALQKDWELWKEDRNNLWHDLEFYFQPSASWRSDTEGLALILFKQARIMSFLCQCQLKEGKSNETYAPERWYESAESQIERINTGAGVSPLLQVVFGMLPDPEGEEGKLFCESFILNNYSPASNIPVGKIFEENPLHGNMLIKQSGSFFHTNDRGFYGKECSRKELNVLSYPRPIPIVIKGKQCWRTAMRMLTLTSKSCLVKYEGSNTSASQSFPVIVQKGKRNEAIEKDMEAILLQMKIGSPGAKGLEKFSVANVNYDREEVLKQWGQGKQKSVSPQQQVGIPQQLPMPSIQRQRPGIPQQQLGIPPQQVGIQRQLLDILKQFPGIQQQELGILQQLPDILRQMFENQKQQGEQLKQMREMIAKRDVN